MSTEVPPPKIVDPVIRQPGEEVLHYGGVVVARLIHNVGVDLQQMAIDHGATIDQIEHNNARLEALANSQDLDPKASAQRTLDVLMDGIDIAPENYNGVKVVASGQTWYAPLPAKEIAAPGEVRDLPVGTLVEYRGTYWVVSEPNTITQCLHPLGPAVEVKGTDFSDVEPGKLAHSDNGKYYIVTNDGKGVETDAQLQKYVDQPAPELLAAWKNQYIKLNNELGKTTQDEQIRLQNLVGEHNKLLGFLSSLVSVLGRMREKVAANI
ncbi:MAG: hypothetical protein ACO1N5_17745 [Noviherbaspirillum sp.]